MIFRKLSFSIFILEAFFKNEKNICHILSSFLCEELVAILHQLRKYLWLGLDSSVCLVFLLSHVIVTGISATYIFIIIFYCMHMYLIRVHNALNHSQWIFRISDFVQNLTECLKPCDTLTLFSHASIIRLEICSLWQLCSLCGSSNLSGNRREGNFTSSLAGINTSCLESKMRISCPLCRNIEVMIFPMKHL